VCTYTKGFYRNHPLVTLQVIVGMGGNITVGSAHLNATDAQAILNATPGKPGNVTFSNDNLLLNLVQQLITGELNTARGSNASSAVQSAIAQANSGITVTKSGGQINISTSLGSSESTLTSTIEGFNSASDCG
jgi:hypothetical protein